MSFVRRQEAVQNMMMVSYTSFEERLISFVKLFNDAGSSRTAVFERFAPVEKSIEFVTLLAK